MHGGSDHVDVDGLLTDAAYAFRLRAANEGLVVYANATARTRPVDITPNSNTPPTPSGRSRSDPPRGYAQWSVTAR